MRDYISLMSVSMNVVNGVFNHLYSGMYSSYSRLHFTYRENHLHNYHKYKEKTKKEEKRKTETSILHTQTTAHQLRDIHV